MEEGEERVSVFISLDSVRNEISRGGTRALQRRRTLRLHPRWTCIAQRDVIHSSLMARDTPVVFIFPLNITLSRGVSEEEESIAFLWVECLLFVWTTRLSACLQIFIIQKWQSLFLCLVITRERECDYEREGEWEGDTRERGVELPYWQTVRFN